MSTAIALRHDTDSSIQVAERLHKSGLFKDTKDANQSLAKILAGQEFGLGPVAAMNGMYIIDGKLVPGAHVLAGCIKRHPTYDYRVKRDTAGMMHDNARCVLVFFELIGAAWAEIGESAFTMEDAKRAGLASRTNWQKYPRNMLFARALSNGLRWFAPDATSGGPVLTYEEVADEADIEIVAPAGSYPQPVAAIPATAEAAPDVTETMAGELYALYVRTGWKGTADVPGGAEDEHAFLRLQLQALGAPSAGAMGPGLICQMSRAQYDELKALMLAQIKASTKGGGA